MKIYNNLFIILIILMISGCKDKITQVSTSEKTVINSSKNIHNDAKDTQTPFGNNFEITYHDTDEIFFIDWGYRLYGFFSGMGKTKINCDFFNSSPLQNKEKIKTVDYDDDGIADFYYENGQMVGYYDKEFFYGKGGFERYSFDEFGRITSYYAAYEFDSNEHYSDYRYEYKFNSDTGELVMFIINNGTAKEQYCEKKNGNIIELRVLRRRNEYREDIRTIKEEFKVLELKGVAHINDEGKIDDILLIYFNNNADIDHEEHCIIKYNSDGSIEVMNYYKKGNEEDYYLKEYNKTEKNPELCYLMELYERNDSGETALRSRTCIEYLDKDKYGNYTRERYKASGSDYEYIQNRKYTYYDN
ncbi:MAG: hypothetical protein IK002_08615 [Treponema sp.]|uniref:hypothetical protein n=1 Tax=Treponema sp. TaxID=166 RepID=UPI00298D6483|nr:hypothetical protein [Treponema sp.]MBR5934031.1 hypothetical protein [Treponema sp.]